MNPLLLMMLMGGGGGMSNMMLPLMLMGGMKGGDGKTDDMGLSGLTPMMLMMMNKKAGMLSMLGLAPITSLALSGGFGRKRRRRGRRRGRR